MKDEKKEGHSHHPQSAEVIAGLANLPVVHEGSCLGMSVEELVRKHKNTPLMPNDDLQLGCG